MRTRIRTGLIALGVVLLALSGTAAIGDEGATQRPIEEWVEQQGTFCFPDGTGGCLLFVPPIENFLGWTDFELGEEGTSLSVDYAGLADDWVQEESNGEVTFGTTFSGSVTERPLADGRAEVHVRLKTDHALAWAVDGTDFANDPLLFGYRAPDVLAGAEPAFATSHLSLRFINTAPGAALPDLLQLFVEPEEGQEVLFLGFGANGKGPLSDGRPGRVHTTQRALLDAATRAAGGSAVSDGFPVERILLRPVGK